MTNFREIVTKAVVGKGKKTFSNHYTLIPTELPTTILGCWVINHKFTGTKQNNKILVEGSCDVNIWYSYNNDTKTEVATDKIAYNEILSVAHNKENNLEGEEEIIVRSLKEPTCTKVEIKDGNIEYDIEKELGIEIVGDTKVRIPVDDKEDEWEEIPDEENEEDIMQDIDENVKEDFIKDKK